MVLQYTYVHVYVQVWPNNTIPVVHKMDGMGPQMTWTKMVRPRVLQYGMVWSYKSQSVHMYEYGHMNAVGQLVAAMPDSTACVGETSYGIPKGSLARPTKVRLGL